MIVIRTWMDQKISICNHISVNATYSKEGDGEYENELHLYCEVCKKEYNILIEIG